MCAYVCVREKEGAREQGHGGLFQATSLLTDLIIKWTTLRTYTPSVNPNHHKIKSILASEEARTVLLVNFGYKKNWLHFPHDW